MTADASTQQQATARQLAAMPYERAIHVCLQCGREGENTTGKEYGRHRFCSPECMAAFREATA